MKKNSPPILALLAIFLLCFGFTATSTAQSPESITPTLQPGDLNGDGFINAIDGNIILAYDAGLALYSDILHRAEAGAGDVNGDGSINARDALIILSYDQQVPLEKPALGNAVIRKVASGKDQVVEQTVDILTVKNDQAETGTMEMTILVDMNRVGQRLGSYKANIAWNPGTLRILEVQGGPKGFGHPVVNFAEHQDGRVTIVDANPHGVEGMVYVTKLIFEVLDEDQPDELEVKVSNVSGAGTLSSFQANMDKRIY